ncbi:hypothetical protein SAMN05216559_0368 [Halomicrobium zhouii]|uniref:Uncharacterized protein n=1 Tax=Halomicrobium zhouii TaxID=767519 RepID=A0A1I6K8G7_9EURY|nr:hypothetical protein SAMN05216559_0368 [Halomicrobium zhouii]
MAPHSEVFILQTICSMLACLLLLVVFNQFTMPRYTIISYFIFLLVSYSHYGSFVSKRRTRLKYIIGLSTGIAGIAMGIILKTRVELFL